MKVKDLIALLSAVNPEAPIFIFDGEEEERHLFAEIDAILEKPFVVRKGRLNESIHGGSIDGSPPAVVLKQRLDEVYRSPVYCNCPGCGRLPEPASFCDVCAEEREESDRKEWSESHVQA